jgi:hypothetical protein
VKEPRRMTAPADRPIRGRQGPSSRQSARGCGEPPEHDHIDAQERDDGDEDQEECLS